MAIVSRERDDRDVAQQLIRCLCWSTFRSVTGPMMVVAAESSPIAGPREAVVTTTTGSGATDAGSSLGFVSSPEPAFESDEVLESSLVSLIGRSCAQAGTKSPKGTANPKRASKIFTKADRIAQLQIGSVSVLPSVESPTSVLFSTSYLRRNWTVGGARCEKGAGSKCENVRNGGSDWF